MNILAQSTGALAVPGMPMPPPLENRSKIPILIAVFAVLGVVFMGMSLITPWYDVKASVFGIDLESSNDFSGTTVKMANISVTQKWSDQKNVDKTRGVYSLTQIMVILGLVMCVLLLIGGLMLRKGPGKRTLAMTFGVLALLFALLGPLMFMVQHPGAMKSDLGSAGSTTSGPQNSFMGSESGISWGPGIGWIMGLMGFIFALIGFILVLLVKKAGPIPPANPQIV